MKNEDQLLSIVNHLYSKNKKYSILYEYVYFTNVEPKSISEFVHLFDLNDLTVEMWKSLSNRLCQKVEINESAPETRYNKKQVGVTFSYDSNKKFDGILNYLLKKFNGNIKNEVKVTSLSNISSDYAENVFLFNDDEKLFYSNDKQDQWLCFDFIEHKIIPTNYTIKSTSSADKPKSWVIEGSNDNSTWHTIDERKDDSNLKNDWTIHTYDIPNKMNTAYRYVRIRQTGLNWYNRYYLTFTSFEFYGIFI